MSYIQKEMICYLVDIGNYEPEPTSIWAEFKQRKPSQNTSFQFFHVLMNIVLVVQGHTNHILIWWKQKSAQLFLPNNLVWWCHIITAKRWEYPLWHVCTGVTSNINTMYQCFHCIAVTHSVVRGRIQASTVL